MWRHDPSPGEHFQGEEASPRQNIHVSGDKVLPRGGSTSLRSRGNPVTAQNVSNGLIPTRGGPGCSAHRRCDRSPSRCSLVPFAPRGLPLPVEPWGGLDTADAWSHRTFSATSLRYEVRMVSGLAPHATSRSPLAPSFPISARVARSGLSTAVSMAASPSEYGSPQPDIHSAAEAP